MRDGDFYASTGVFIDEINWDRKKRTINLNIRPVGNTTFRSLLVGTRKNYKALADADQSGIGEVIGIGHGTALTFEVPEDVLYVRVTITTDLPAANPSYEGQKMQAWTQPVGWR